MTRCPDFKEAFCREVTLYDMFLGKFTISVSRFVKLLTDPTGLIFLTLSWLLLTAADPNGLRVTHGPLFALLIWFFSVGLYVSVIYGVIGMLAILQHRYNFPHFFAPLTSGCTIFAVYVVVQNFIAWATQNPNGPELFPLFFNVLVAGLALETIFVRFVLSTKDAVPAKKPTPTLVQIGERKFPIAKISHLNAQEHYVQVTLVTETVMIRGRIGDAVNQTKDPDGIQPHRSWWIAKTAEPLMSRKGGKDILTLNDGTEVPIAKARVTDVRRWLDLYQTW